MADVLAEALVVIGGQIAADLAEGLVRQLEDVDVSAEDTAKALEKIQTAADKAGQVASKGFSLVSDTTGRAGESLATLGGSVVGTTDSLAQFGLISQEAADGVATGFSAVTTTLDSVSQATALASEASTLYSGVLTKLPAVQKAVALGQKAINLALAANPVGLIVAAIALFVAGLVLAYKKSETFRTVVNAAFNGIKAAASVVFGFITKYIQTQVKIWTTVFNGVKKVLGSIWTGVAGAAKTAFNGLLSVLRPIAKVINALITGANAASLGKLNIPKIPAFADGVRNFSGGLALVGERGPEIVNLPKGSDVYTNGQSRGMAGNTQNNTYIFNGPESFAAARANADWSAKHGTRFGSATRAVVA